MGMRIAIAGVALFICAVLLSVSPAQAQSQDQSPTSTQPDPRLNPAAHVYVFTGFGGAGRSYIDGVADKVRQRRLPTTVSSPGDMPSVAASALERYKSGRLRSIVILGYSMGGGAAMKMAAELGRANIPVRLVLTVDPVDVPALSPNVRRLVNYYVPGGVSGPIARPKNFHGSLQNIAEPDLGHFSIATTREPVYIDLIARAAIAAAAAPAAAPAAPPGTTATATATVPAER